jgi:mitochondrial fission protein ELM1
MTDAWVITDGAAGNQRQALALAQALGLRSCSLTLGTRAPWSWLAPRLTLGGRLAWPAAQRSALAPPWPTLAIGCGRDAALATRLLRKLSQGACRSVQILDPHAPSRHWDLLIAPRHDDLEGSNVLHPIGSLHPVDAAWLAAGREAHAAFAALPRPRLALLLGGPRRGVTLDAAWTAALIASLRARLAHDGGSVLLCASRRTPPSLVASVGDGLAGVPGVRWRGAQDGPNPYPGLLAWADRVIVSPDSVNMLSEAAATGVPVHTLTRASLPRRLARFHAALRAGGWLSDIDTDSAPPAQPLRETAAIAAEVAHRLGLDVAHGGR